MTEPTTSTSSTDTEGSGQMGMGMKAAVMMLRNKFSGVNNITTNTLNGWLQPEGSKENVVVMDCRDQSEYAVSHINGAQLVDWKNADPQQLIADLPKDKPCTVVCYCSMGYRSSALADKMQNFLTTSVNENMPEVKVYNLEGSLFQWANEGRAMVDASGQPTKLCHPYNAVWGKMLNRHLRSSVSSSVD